MPDPALPAGFTLDQGAPPPPAGFTVDQPQEQDTMAQVRAMVEGGKSSKDIHAFLQSVHRDQDFKNIDSAVSYRDAHKGDASGINYVRTKAPVLDATNRAEAAGTELSNGYLGGWLDKATAGIEAVAPIDKWLGSGSAVRSIWDGSSLPEAYHRNLDLARAESSSNDKAYPVQSLAMNAAGAVASPINKVGGPLAGDLAYGASYGAGSSDASTWAGLAGDATEGAVLNAAGGVVGRKVVGAIGHALSPVVGKAQQALADAGVTMTPGQLIGGTAKKLEDLATSIPFVGQAIQAGRDGALHDFAIGAINKALDPLGAKIPENMSGNEAMAYAQEVFDKAYNAAKSGLSFSVDGDFAKGLNELKGRLMRRGPDSLAPQYQKQFMDVVKGTLGTKLEGGAMDGDTLKSVLSRIDRKAATFSAGNNPGEAQEFGRALSELSGLIESAARRNPASDPGALKLLEKTDLGYAMMVRVENAAKMRGGEPGMFSPNQLDSAVQRGDGTARNRAYLRGDALMQDYSAAAKKVLPSSYGDSGTAPRAALMHAIRAAGGIAATGASAYEAGRGDYVTAGLLGAGALAAGAAYSKPGAKVIQKALIGARPASVAAVGQKLNAFAPTAGLITGAGANAFAVQHATK